MVESMLLKTLEGPLKILPFKNPYWMKFLSLKISLVRMIRMVLLEAKKAGAWIKIKI